MPKAAYVGLMVRGHVAASQRSRWNRNALIQRKQNRRGISNKSRKHQIAANETKESDSKGSHYKQLSFVINRSTQQKEFFLSELGGPTLYKLMPHHYTANIRSKKQTKQWVMYRTPNYRSPTAYANKRKTHDIITSNLGLLRWYRSSLVHFGSCRDETRRLNKKHIFQECTAVTPRIGLGIHELRQVNVSTEKENGSWQSLHILP